MIKIIIKIIIIIQVPNLYKRMGHYNTKVSFKYLPNSKKKTLPNLNLISTFKLEPKRWLRGHVYIRLAKMKVCWLLLFRITLHLFYTLISFMVKYSIHHLKVVYYKLRKINIFPHKNLSTPNDWKEGPWKNRINIFRPSSAESSFYKYTQMNGTRIS